MSEEVVLSKDTSKKSYRACLKIFSLFLRIIGIDLKIDNEKPPVWLSCTTILYTIIWLVLHVSSSAIRYTPTFYLANATERTYQTIRKTKTGSFNMAILSTASTIQSIGAHFGLVLLIVWHWNDLWTSILRMERQLKPSNQSYKYFSYLVTAGIIYIALVSFAIHLRITDSIISQKVESMQEIPQLLYYMWNTAINDDYSTLGEMAKIHHYLTGPFPKICAVFYSIISFLVSANYKMIADTIETFEAADRDTASRFQTAQMRRWRKQLAFAYECADRLNRTFGSILLLIISSIFIFVINISFL